MSNEVDIEKKEQANYEKELETILQYLETEDGETQFGLETFQELLALPDDKFELLSETFLNEIEKSFSGNAEVFALIAKQKGYELEEFQQTYAAIEADLKQSDLSPKKQDFLMRFIGILFNAFFENEGIFKRIITIPFEKCREVTSPAYANPGDAGMDVYSPDDYEIGPGETIVIPTGIKMAIPKGYAILIQPRSGQSVKTKLRVANTPGLIDSGYRDEIGVIVENIEPAFKDIEYDFNDDGTVNIKSILHGNTYTIEKGQRFAQMRLVEVPTAALMEVENVGEIGENRGGGFGSSGIN